MSVLRAALFAGIAAVPAGAQTVTPNTYGQPGLIDMPSAFVFPDAELSFTTSYFVDQTRNTLAFQITPRLMGTFGYALLYGTTPNAEGLVSDFRFDRSFSLRYQIADEGRVRPALAIGLNDFLGTGLYASEYLVASKTVTPDLRVTAGLGWGRFAGVDSFSNPLGFLGDRFEDRELRSTTGFGGQVEAKRWFTGDAAVFAGLEYSPDDRTTYIAEYAPDAYPFEAPFVFDRKNSLNLGLRYRLNDNVTLGAQYLYGSELGVQVSFGANPLDPPQGSGRDPAPPLVGAGMPAGFTGPVAARLAEEGVTLVGLTLQDTSARVEIENDRYMAAAQAVGRTARVLTTTLPKTVQAFDIVLVAGGLPVTRSRITRSTLQDEEFALDGAWDSQVRSRIVDAGPGRTPLDDLYPRLDYGLSPYLSPSLFDPDSPLRADVGVDLTASAELLPGLTFAGVLRQPLLGNLDDSTRESTSVLPRVRSDSYLYAKAGTSLRRLTASYAFRPAPDYYAKLTAGYLEPMFGGVAAELLWYPVASRLALGAEVAQVRQRDFDQRFGFQDYEITTGHLSAYYAFGDGYHAQIDAGRFLAGDVGATFALDRTFENGWRVGAFATLTDVPFDTFGEGSFDKGIRVTIPTNFITGLSSRDTPGLTIRPVLRDGGARLFVPERLYDTVREDNGRALADGWGRFWR